MFEPNPLPLTDTFAWR